MTDDKTPSSVESDELRAVVAGPLHKELLLAAADTIDAQAAEIARMRGALPTDKLDLTKRELIAAMAMKGMLSNPHWVRSPGAAGGVAQDALIAADALLAELSGKQETE
jgi:hypothetical protein